MDKCEPLKLSTRRNFNQGLPALTSIILSLAALGVSYSSLQATSAFNKYLQSANATVFFDVDREHSSMAIKFVNAGPATASLVRAEVCAEDQLLSDHDGAMQERIATILDIEQSNIEDVLYMANQGGGILVPANKEMDILTVYLNASPEQPQPYGKASLGARRLETKVEYCDQAGTCKELLHSLSGKASCWNKENLK